MTESTQILFSDEDVFRTLDGMIEMFNDSTSSLVNWGNCSFRPEDEKRGVLVRNASHESIDDEEHGALHCVQHNSPFNESFVSTQDDDPTDAMTRRTSCTSQLFDFNPLDIERNREEGFEHDDISDGNTYSEDSIKVALERIMLNNENM